MKKSYALPLALASALCLLAGSARAELVTGTFTLAVTSSIAPLPAMPTPFTGTFTVDTAEIDMARIHPLSVEPGRSWLYWVPVVSATLSGGDSNLGYTLDATLGTQQFPMAIYRADGVPLAIDLLFRDPSIGLGSFINMGGLGDATCTTYGLGCVESFGEGRILSANSTTGIRGGIVHLSGGFVHALPIVRPVPEPTTWAMMLAGCALLLGAKAKRR